MTLIEDIALLARYAQETARRGGGPRDELSAAANRVLAVHTNGGLPRAILGQKVQELESRLVTEIRRTAEELSRGG